MESLELKRMSKKTGDKLYKLNISHEAVKGGESRIKSVEKEIYSIFAEEHEERDMRKADMEIKKLENMADHRT